MQEKILKQTEVTTLHHKQKPPMKAPFFIRGGLIAIVALAECLWATRTSAQVLSIQQINTNIVVLSWSAPGYFLQSASSPTNTFFNVCGSISPYTNAITGTQQYFRLTSQDCGGGS